MMIQGAGTVPGTKQGLTKGKGYCYILSVTIEPHPLRCRDLFSFLIETMFSALTSDFFFKLEDSHIQHN